jgi:MarR family transcriptional regulator, negative regulator of the multidrug operon emrRAB
MTDSGKLAGSGRGVSASEASLARSANLLGAVSLAVADAMRRATEDAAGHASAGPAALVALDQFLDGRSMEDLRRAMGLTGSGAVRLVDRLEADGYVRRRAGRDGRTLALVLTARGRRAAERVQAARVAALEAVLDGLDDAERTQLARLHERLLEGVTRQRLAAREADELERAAWLCRLCDFEACGRPHGACPAARVTGGGGDG